MALSRKDMIIEMLPGLNKLFGMDYVKRRRPIPTQAELDEMHLLVETAGYESMSQMLLDDRFIGVMHKDPFGSYTTEWSTYATPEEAQMAVFKKYLGDADWEGEEDTR